MKPTKALILFLAPLALAACSSDPEWADLEAHEKTVELQERYAPLLVGTWQLVWERKGSEGDGRNIISLSASFDDETTLSQLYYNAYSLYATLYSLTDKSLCFSGGFVHNGENDETVFTRDDAEPSF